MNKTLIGLVITGFIVLMIVMSISGQYNSSVKSENNIVAQYDKDENSLAQLSLKVVDIIKVGDRAKKDAVEIITSAMKGKYGDSGSTASFLWSADSPLKIDISLRKEVARIIDGGRSNFEQSQNVRIDKCRQYKTELDYLFSGTVKHMLGFPKLDMEKYCTIVSSGHAKKAFETKVDTGFIID